MARPAALEAFKKMDRSGDGSISVSEMCHWIDPHGRLTAAGRKPKVVQAPVQHAEAAVPTGTELFDSDGEDEVNSYSPTKLSTRLALVRSFDPDLQRAARPAAAELTRRKPLWTPKRYTVPPPSTSHHLPLRAVGTKGRPSPSPRVARYTAAGTQKATESTTASTIAAIDAKAPLATATVPPVRTVPAQASSPRSLTVMTPEDWHEIHPYEALRGSTGHRPITAPSRQWHITKAASKRDITRVAQVAALQGRVASPRLPPNVVPIPGLGNKPSPRSCPQLSARRAHCATHSSRPASAPFTSAPRPPSQTVMLGPFGGNRAGAVPIIRGGVAMLTPRA